MDRRGEAFGRIGLKILCFLSNIWIGFGVMSMCMCVCILSLGLRGVIVCLSVDVTAVSCRSHFVHVRYNLSRARGCFSTRFSLTYCPQLAAGNLIHYTLQSCLMTEKHMAIKLARRSINFSHIRLILITSTVASLADFNFLYSSWRSKKSSFVVTLRQHHSALSICSIAYYRTDKGALLL